MGQNLHGGSGTAQTPSGPMVPDGAHGYHWEYYHEEDRECLDQGAVESCTSTTPDQPRGGRRRERLGAGAQRPRRGSPGHRSPDEKNSWVTKHSCLRARSNEPPGLWGSMSCSLPNIQVPLAKSSLLDQSLVRVTRSGEGARHAMGGDNGFGRCPGLLRGGLFYPESEFKCSQLVLILLNAILYILCVTLTSKSFHTLYYHSSVVCLISTPRVRITVICFLLVTN